MRKGNRYVCDNHRGISLLFIAGKILVRVMFNQLKEHLNLLTESQCGFRARCSTIDMTFAAWQLQEKCQEQNVALVTTFVDLTKAFDTVCRERLWKIMAKFGCPTKFTAMVKQFHDGMNARVQDNGEYSLPFLVTNGVNQCCVLAPTLFSMMFSAMLTDAFRDGTIGVGFRHHTDAKPPYSLEVASKDKSDEYTVFADDFSQNASTQSEMQDSMDLCAKACEDFSFTINQPQLLPKQTTTSPSAVRD